MKRKCSAKQLRALARGRKIRKQNLRKKGKRPLRRTTSTRRVTQKRRKYKRRNSTGNMSAYIRSLTGGSKDVNPQFMHGKVLLSAADTITEGSFNVPVVRIPSTNRATIMEVLKIWLYPPDFINTAAADVRQVAVCSFSTIAQGITTFAGYHEPNVFCQYTMEKESAFTALQGMTTYSPIGPFLTDLTDGAGHGLLIAGDRIFVQADTGAFGVAVTFSFKILYRLKSVALTEYIGIVQSQQ